MPTTNNARNLCEQRLHALLTTHILAADGYHWPGSDSMVIDDVLHEYPKAAELGRVPGRAELCQKHPELASAVAHFFDCVRPTI